MRGNFTIGQNLGIAVFVLTAGLPALEAAGYGFGLQWGLPIFLLLSAAGGALGGALLGRSRRIAGLLGGLLAGPCGLLAVFFYVRNRTEVWNVELVLVQAVASLPGLGLYFLLKFLIPGPEAPNPGAGGLPDHYRTLGREDARRAPEHRAAPDDDRFTKE